VKEFFMRLFAARLLMLSCSLLLALPPGWCCIFALGTIRNDAAKPAPCCRSCCHQSKPTMPTPQPEPHKPGRCPCDDRQTTVPDSVKALHGGLAVLVALPALDPAPLGLTVAVSDRFSLPISASPQLLHCVWLC
jgi:hypothetical protein